MLAAGDGTEYSRLHEHYHSRYRNYLNQFGFYDIFIVEPDDGRIVYSVFKELDFGTSLIDGPYKSTNFARVFNKAKNATEPNQVFFEDFETYVPSYGAPAAFIASPIFEGARLVGVLVFQMPLDRINAVMYQTAGMGESGEIMLVGEDYKMRSQSRLSEENTVLVREVRNAAVTRALNGQQGTHEIKTTDGRDLLASYSPVELLGHKWAIVATMDRDEALSSSLTIIKLGLDYWHWESRSNSLSRNFFLPKSNSSVRRRAH